MADVTVMYLPVVMNASCALLLIYLVRRVTIFQRWRRFTATLCTALVICLLTTFQLTPQHAPLFSTTPLDDGWEFPFDERTWISVTLPHTPRLEPIEKIEQHWQGTCFYRTQLPIDPTHSHVTLQFDAAMHEADVWLDDSHVAHHLGGYLPFSIHASNGRNVKVRLHNTDDPIIPPGKNLSGLDFNYYGGLYRRVWLVRKSPRLRLDRHMRVRYEKVS